MSKCYRIEISDDNGETWSDAFPGAVALSREVADSMLAGASRDGASVRIVESEFPL